MTGPIRLVALPEETALPQGLEAAMAEVLPDLWGDGVRGTRALAQRAAGVDGGAGQRRLPGDGTAGPGMAAGGDLSWPPSLPRQVARGLPGGRSPGRAAAPAADPGGRGTTCSRASQAGLPIGGDERQRPRAVGGPKRSLGRGTLKCRRGPERSVRSKSRWQGRSRGAAKIRT